MSEPQGLPKMVDPLEPMRNDPLVPLQIPRHDVELEHRPGKPSPAIRRNKLIRLLDDDVVHGKPTPRKLGQKTYVKKPTQKEYHKCSSPIAIAERTV
jgi:hypothetical protein